VTYKQFEVVRVPFPFTDRDSVKNRPALIISTSKAFNTPAGHSVMAMITSADNNPWPLDCPIRDLKSAGLSAASVIRCKLFTLDHRLVRGSLGKLGSKDQIAIRAALDSLLALTT
jgi:mRNA interferase MazF